MNLQNVINSRFGVGLAFGLGRAVPPKFGKVIAVSLADWIASRRNSLMVRSVRTNQWVVSGESLDSEQLQHVVQETFRHTAISQYLFYHYINNIQGMLNLVDFSSSIEVFFDKAHRHKEKKAILVSVHMTNFELIMHAAASRGLDAIAISPPNPGQAYQWQNKMRTEVGLRVIPSSKDAFRQALAWLEAGNTVFTGIDRPVDGRAKYRPRFFGRPSSLPVAHVDLALKADVPIYLVAMSMRSDGIYEVTISDPIIIQKHSDRPTTLVQNAENILKLAEGIILKTPHQWSMAYPVWPEAIELTPA